MSEFIPKKPFRGWCRPGGADVAGELERLHQNRCAIRVVETDGEKRIELFAPGGWRVLSLDEWHNIKTAKPYLWRAMVKRHIPEAEADGF